MYIDTFYTFLSIAAIWRSVEFGEGEKLDAAEGELPAANVFLHVLHPAAIPAYIQSRAERDTNTQINIEAWACNGLRLAFFINI